MINLAEDVIISCTIRCTTAVAEEKKKKKKSKMFNTIYVNMQNIMYCIVQYYSGGKPFMFNKYGHYEPPCSDFHKIA